MRMKKKEEEEEEEEEENRIYMKADNVDMINLYMYINIYTGFKCPVSLTASGHATAPCRPISVLS
jgi:hypothetical protein